MANLFKKFIEWLKSLFGHKPTPSPSPTPKPSPTPLPSNEPVPVMVTNMNGENNIMGIQINGVFVQDINYPVEPGQQKVGSTLEKRPITTVTVYFNDLSINESIRIGTTCVETGMADMCVVYPVDSVYGVTIYYNHGTC